MTKDKNVKLVLSDLIAKKIQKEQSKPKAREVYVASLEGTLTIDVPDEEDLLQAVDSISRDDSMGNVIKIYDELIYGSIQILRSTELHEEYEVVEPFEIVGKLLTLAERLDIGSKIIENSGLSDLDAKVKN